MSDDILKIREFHVKDVVFGDGYSFKDSVLTIPQSVNFDLPKEILSINIRIIKKDNRHLKVNSIMDIIPISTKVSGKIGTGVSHTLTGVEVMLTGASASGIQIHDFGSSDGYLDEKMVFGRNGTPDEDDIIIGLDVITAEDYSLDRAVITKIFELVDDFIQPIRKILKVTNGRYADYVGEYRNNISNGKPKVVVIKQVSGQGAMYDNILFPNEPCGIKGGVSIIDMNNFPTIVTPNEYRDGIIHALV